MMKILLDRFIKNSQIEISEGFEWIDNKPIIMQDIGNAVKNGTIGTAEPFGDRWKNWPKEVKDEQYHISRVIYFINHPEEIKDIEIDNRYWQDRYTSYIYPTSEIIDGWHRFAAAVYIGLKEIDVIYGGRIDVLDYLMGKTDIEPTEII